MEYTLKDIAALVKGELIGADHRVLSVFTDSRNSCIDPGALFIAICGQNHDGHAFIDELYGKGVRAFVTEREVAADRYPDAGFVRCEGSVGALQRLAADHRSRFKGTVVGITGSNGKTVVKEWIAGLVPPGVKMFRSPKSYNSQIGVPLSLLMIRGDEELAVIEAGISEPGEMSRLEEIIRPQIGIVTTMGDAHQKNFESFESKVREKLSLFRNCGKIIYNSSYPLIKEILRLEYSSAELIDSSGQSEAYAMFGERASRENAASAAALCYAMGYDHAGTVDRMRHLQPVAMRLELKEGIHGSVIINDSYNSDINSLSIALDYLESVAADRRRTLVLSDILQSGLSESELYGEVARLLSHTRIDRLVGIGERIKLNGALFQTECEFYPTTEAYLAAIRREDIAGRVVLIKGNRGLQFEKLSGALEQKRHTTTLEIDLDAMRHNLNEYRRLLAPGTKVMAMVKASGYGNGSYEVAGMLQHEGVDYLAVAFADEGMALRERGITMPIVVLNADSDSFDLMIANSLEPEIYNFTSLAHFVAALKRFGERSYPVHIKIDTGMHRLGFGPADAGELVAMLQKHKDTLHVASVFSHLAASDDPAQDSFTHGQIALFDEVSRQIVSSLPYKPLRHIANSAAIERLPDARFDMVRLGIGLYGFGAGGGIDLKPVSTLRSRIVQIKELDPNQTVGYGREGRLDGPGRIAIVPVGYADGLNRRLGCGQWSMTVNGKQAPTVGRISMDTCAIDVTGIEAAEGDPVVIFGDQPGNGIPDMAERLQTIPYEIMTGISARVKRIFIKE